MHDQENTDVQYLKFCEGKEETNLNQKSKLKQEMSKSSSMMNARDREKIDFKQCVDDRK